MEHSFNIEVAKEVGILEAVILKNIIFWCAKNEADGNKNNFYEGRYWVYNSVKAWSMLIPYANERQIRYALDKLKEYGYIYTGKFGKNTIWYAPTEQALYTHGVDKIVKPDDMSLTKLSNEIDKIGKPESPVCQNCQTEFDKIVNPYITYINNTDIKHNTDIKQQIDTTDTVDKIGKPYTYDDIMERYNNICTLLPVLLTMSETRKRKLKTLLDRYSIDDLYKAFEKAQASPFLTGNNERGWRPNFDWITSPTNLLKILEGNYDKVDRKEVKAEEVKAQQQNAIANFLAKS